MRIVIDGDGANWVARCKERGLSVSGRSAASAFARLMMDMRDPPEPRTAEPWGLSVRTTHVMKTAGVETPEDAAQFTRQEWLQKPNFGRKSLRELEEWLAGHGMTLPQR
jgi:DNA-directed RNA polymerase alpha subunit